MAKIKYKESFLGDTYCQWTVVDEFDKISSKTNTLHYLKIECSCGYSKSITKDCFARRGLLDKCHECIKKAKEFDDNSD